MLRLYLEALSDVFQPIVDGRCVFGVLGTGNEVPCNLRTEKMGGY